MVRPMYGASGCQVCRFIDHFSGADWYYCPGDTPRLVSRLSTQPHDQSVRLLTEIPKAGTWRRAYDLAVAKGLT